MHQVVMDTEGEKGQNSENWHGQQCQEDALRHGNECRGSKKMGVWVLGTA